MTHPDHPDGASAGMEIAIIGMSGRFPGAADVEAFWQNLRDGVESISRFSEAEVLAAGVSPELARNPHYVRAGGVLEGADRFDAGFFGVYPREAELMDPQHRVFLECAWEALEHAGYDPERARGPIGVFAGCGLNTYLLFNLLDNPEAREACYQLGIGNDKDFLPTRVSYKLNLRGPSVNVQTACSTSLVAAHLACQSLLSYACDMALAGGVTIRVPQQSGYLYQDGGILAPDGHCRPFDADARGTVGSNGVGIVVLKRLEDALADGDTIYAVIKGSAINNDGAAKVGYTAPGVDGQAEVIAMAQAIAGVPPESIGYVEAHGTGTPLGDPIELAALTQAFRLGTDRRGFCAIGSVKSNLGHLDTAAGVAGLIKAALALHRREIPPSLHVARPNPALNLDESPFYVNTSLCSWAAGSPRRAGVSSFGIGGTNAHMVLEEAPPPEPGGPSRPLQLLLVSARSRTALDTATANLAAHLRRATGQTLADIAFTTQVGRRGFAWRRAVVAASAADAAAALEQTEPPRVLTGQAAERRPVAFLFSGQGAQYAGMAAGLYAREPRFREALDRCADLLRPELEGVDVRDVIVGQRAKAGGRGTVDDGRGAADGCDPSAELGQTRYTQPALFAVEYALAQLWMGWGIRPAAMLGHSVGEYVAACLAGVFPLDDALRLIAARGRLMQALPPGVMLSVPLAEDALRPLLPAEASLAAVNGPALCVAAGPADAIAALERRLEARGVAGRRLATSHAFHSAMMEPIRGDFAALVARAAPRPPQLPFVSNVTGRWITADEATDPAYWARHLRQTVRFADGLAALLADPDMALLEVGPGQTLTSLARRHPDWRPERVAVASLRHPDDAQDDQACLLAALARLWIAGAPVDWAAFSAGERRRRVPLPTYPFERRRYWVEPQPRAAAAGSHALHKRPDPAEWLYLPSWQRAALTSTGVFTGPLVLLGKEDARTAALARAIRAAGGHLLRSFDEVADGAPTAAIWLAPDAPAEDAAGLLEGLLADAAALGRRAAPARLLLVTRGAHDVTGDEALLPAHAALAGAARVVALEYPHLTVHLVDLERRTDVPAGAPPDSHAPTDEGAAGPGAAGRAYGTAASLSQHDTDQTARWLLAELAAPATGTAVAYRGRYRWAQTYAPPGRGSGAPLLRHGGVYLITGGLGRVGLALAEDLARGYGAKLALLSRSAPEEALDGAAEVVARIAALGGEALLIRGDAADPAHLRAAIGRVEARFGALHGVFHCAGLVGDAALRPVAATDGPLIAAHLRPKLGGALALAAALAGRTLDFVLLQSSLSAALGGLGMAAYAAANAALDAMALAQRRAGAPWITVDWDAWQFGGEAPPGTLAALALTPPEGLEVVRRVLTPPTPAQVVVSTADLAARLARTAARPADAAEAPPTHERPLDADSYVPPRDGLEQAIAALWERMLGIARVGAHDNFFELGGHSLLATQIAARLRDAYGVDLPLRQLFESPTVAGVAALIVAGRGASAPPAGIPPAPRDGPLPLSSGQQRLWFLDQLEPGSPLYNNPAAIRLDGPLDAAALERSLAAIVQRHEILRTVFVTRDGRPAQLILPALDTPLRTIDLRGLPAAERAAEVQRLAAADARASFDLTRGPLFRVTLLRTGEQEHVVLLTMHHIVSDGWSIGVLIDELTALYQAYTSGQEPPLAPLPIQYADYAAWQRTWLAGPEATAQLAAWQERLAGDLPPLDLPTDRPRPALQSYAGATRWFALPEALAGAVAALSRREGATPFMTLLAGFAALLHRYSGQETFCVGTPVAGRARPETEGLIGFFVNTLALPADFRGEPTFRELLARTRETALDAFSRQDVPFDALVEAVQPERDLSRTPLFQVMFVMQEARLPRLERAGLRATPLEVDTATAKFDLTLYLEERDGALRGWWNYNTDLFDAATIARMEQHFGVLLAAALAAPDVPVSRLPLLTDDERALLAAWNDTATGDPPAPLVHRVFEGQAAATPDATALVCEGERLSYRELNARANRLARRLRALGVGPEEIVGVCLPRSADAIVALLAVFKAGGVYLPLDPAYPPERLRFMLEDAAPRVVLADDGQGAADGGRWAAVEMADTSLAGESPDDLEGGAGREHAAYIIYTSGSTGQPKGVVIAHGGFADHCRDIVRLYALTPADGVLAFASLNFDASLEQIVPTLMAGARLVLRGPEVWPPADFQRYVLAEGLTVINPPTAYFHQLAQAWAAEPPPLPPGQIRLAIAGGDALLPEYVRLWQAGPAGGARLLNAYGPTETTITAMLCEVSRLSPVPPRIPIGRPLPNRRAYILDRHRQPVPPGVPGELYLGGQGVARGYLHRPELTAERFLEAGGWGLEAGDARHAASLQPPAARLYRTGDLCRFLPDGTIEFLGRVDQQVKIRGFRIEPGEIEAALTAHPDVAAAAVVVREDRSGDRRLVAYVVPEDRDTGDTERESGGGRERGRPGTEADNGDLRVRAADLRTWLSARLPEYMLPSAIVTLDTLPLTPSGKLDRRALPAPEPGTASGATFVAPRDPVEAELARLWAEVLQVERVGVHETFFELGGHSLLAAQLVARVRDTFGVELPLRRLFETPTVAGLALLIAQARAEQTDDAELARLLAELEQLSDDDARSLLSQEVGGD